MPEPRRILFVDLDETLVSTGNLVPEADAPRAVVRDMFGKHTYSVFVRPGAEEALAEARGVFDEVHLYTAADRDYAMAVLKATGLRYAFDEVYTVGEVYAGTQVLPVNARTRWALIDNDEGIAMSKISAVSGPAGVRIAEAMRTHWVYVPDFAPENRWAAVDADATVLFGAVDDAAWRTR